MEKMKPLQNDWFIIFSCWVISLIATLGSLFFSEIMKFPPCTLCWYQRISMYPLVFIFLIGTFHPIKYVIQFSMPLIITGWSVALYHNLLHYKIVPESASPCQEGVSCSTVYIEILGFLTIPMLSLVTFTSLLIILIIPLKQRVLNEK